MKTPIRLLWMVLCAVTIVMSSGAEAQSTGCVATDNFSRHRTMPDENGNWVEHYEQEWNCGGTLYKVFTTSYHRPGEVTTWIQQTYWIPPNFEPWVMTGMIAGAGDPPNTAPPLRPPDLDNPDCAGCREYPE